MTTERKDASKATGLEAMRLPFPEAFISKLPKGTKAQNECPNDQKINCKVCGGWHHPRVIHLDYVGHAAITQRLLEVDPMWFWEPVAFGPDGLPKLDEFGGLWIRLTVLGVTRLGYGDAVGKKFGSTAIKEAIGDAIRNACMRFGAALELWHKGDWEADTLPTEEEDRKPEPKALPPCPQAKLDKWIETVQSGKQTANALMAFATTKHTLTAGQIAQIEALKKPTEKPDETFITDYETGELHP